MPIATLTRCQTSSTRSKGFSGWKMLWVYLSYLSLITCNCELDVNAKICACLHGFQFCTGSWPLGHLHKLIEHSNSKLVGTCSEARTNRILRLPFLFRTQIRHTFPLETKVLHSCADLFPSLFLLPLPLLLDLMWLDWNLWLEDLLLLVYCLYNTPSGV